MMNQLRPTTAQPDTALALRKRIARAFGRSATVYDQHADLQRQVANKLLALLPAQTHPAHVLDLGCGTGYCSAYLRERFPAATVLALDLAEPMLAVAAQQLNAAGPATQVQILCADAQALPLKSNSVDLLVSSLALQWCSDPAVVFAEIRRVLKPGAVALVSTLGPATLQELREAWAEVDGNHHGNEFLPAWQLQQAADAAALPMHIEREVLVRHYDSLLALAHEMKGLGANVVTQANAGTLIAPSAFKAAAAAFARRHQAGGIPVHWEIFCLTLRKNLELTPV